MKFIYIVIKHDNCVVNFHALSHGSGKNVYTSVINMTVVPVNSHAISRCKKCDKKSKNIRIVPSEYHTMPSYTTNWR